ncbi:hypothetical protein FGO68_gene14179 [Halteria grandinella]|uniref:Uncharacterized protein n=1 Tax=Halteria grandinella TaxID=5974 RepID=A0A8J8P669_HALGN|nr:hypothetical protein FGO68_gene14179 [Halteria grandinella]
MSKIIITRGISHSLINLSLLIGPTLINAFLHISRMQHSGATSKPVPQETQDNHLVKNSSEAYHNSCSHMPSRMHLQLNQTQLQSYWKGGRTYPKII